MRYFVTGTQAYGPLSEDSDLDIALHVDDAGYLESFIRGCRIEVTPSSEVHDNQDYTGFHFDLAGIKVNVIVLSEYEFDEWKESTEKLQGLPPIEDKAERIETFNEGRVHRHEHKTRLI